MTKIAIIGAGLAGLTAAHGLKDDANITVFEKARGVGGRMSTRRAVPYFFDHGAQYFTARTKPFQEFTQPLIDEGLIERWNARYVKFNGNEIIERKDWANDEPRYVGVSAMNSMVKHLTGNLNIKLNIRITTLQKDGKWHLHNEQDKSYEAFDWVISSVPAPQAAALLPEEFQHYEWLKNMKMRACFSLMLGFSEPLPLEFEAAHITNADLSWIAVNSSKPGRGGPYTLMVHSSEDYAEAHINDGRDEVLDYLCFETSRIIGYNVGIAEYKAVHGWRYANNARREYCPVFIDRQRHLGACGDWCCGGRVEGAFTAAYNLVQKIREIIL